MNKTVIVFFIVLIHVSFLYAQEFGGNPPSFKWHQINTDTVRIIFPASRKAEAQRVANTIHYLNRNTRTSIGSKQKKLNIVLQNQSVFSNGYVGLAPFMSEFYLQTPQSNQHVGSDWLDLLAIHEYRHALQDMNTLKGFTKLAYYINGEAGWALFSYMSVPNWFWEGDAVVMETSLSEQGRGRMPSFYDGYKNLRLAGISYNYQKARNGSIKDFVPNHYELGYLLCQYGRERYGNEFWGGVMEDASKYKGVFYPFSKGIKRRTGLSVKEFYRKAFIHYDSLWREQEASRPKQQANSRQVNTISKKDTYTSYQFPYFTEDGNIISYKSSYKRIGAFYYLNSNGQEKKIVNQGKVVDAYFSYKNEMLTWAEYGQDERWGWQTFSNIITYDLKSHKRKKLTSGTKYFSPDLSKDRKSILVLRDIDGAYSLCVLNAESGELVHEVPNPENIYFSYPKWDIDGKSIVAIARNHAGKVALAQIEIENGRVEYLTHFTAHQIGIPWPARDHIYFSASFSGSDDIYALERKNLEIRKVAGGVLGDYQVSANEEESELIFIASSSLGNNLMKIPIDKDTWENVDVREPIDMPEYELVANKEEGGPIRNRITDKQFPVEAYPQTSHLLNFHTWGFYADDPYYEFSIRSNNVLNTLELGLGSRYNRNTEDFTYFFDVIYAQLYPIFKFSTSIAPKDFLVRPSNRPDTLIGVSLVEQSYTPGVVLPFDISSGVYSRYLHLLTNYSFYSVKYKHNEALNTEDFNFQSIEFGLQFLNRRKKAKQNIYSKYSQYLFFDYEGALNADGADQLFANGELTFPGLLPNHNLVLQASSLSKQYDSNINFGDSFSYARGYNKPAYDLIYKVGVNYHFPVLYPDLGIGGMVYLYRLRGNLFYDYSRSHLSYEGVKTIKMYNSIGAELVVETNIMNALPINIGLRYNYLLNEDPAQPSMKSNFEVFIPVVRF